ncbi:MAG: hypothetical protein FJ276_30420, partial [Planctomycetes bacterium]|nr:hypothetical protein [Planctomycetota bacterium]
MASSRRVVLGALMMPWCLATAWAGAADEPTREGGWLVQRDARTGAVVRTMELTLHPQGEPRPALKYRLVADDFDLIDGNAAVHYLKAMGFLGQGPAREKMVEFEKRQWDRLMEMREAGNFEASVPPYSWYDMTPAELPLDEVKKYLSYTSFQPRFLREAAKRRKMDLDRQIQADEGVLGYVLPDIQEMRPLAYLQSLRCRVALAEGRINDAIEILGQEYAMAWHLGQDDIVVSNAVGSWCAELAWRDALQLVQRRETPNLYWAFATLPQPLIDLRRTTAFERQLFFEQFKILREVDETLRPVAYWQDFVDRLAPQVVNCARELRLSPNAFRDSGAARESLVVFIAAAYPGARQYLIEQCGLPSEQVGAYPTAQVVALAVVRHYEVACDDAFKHAYLPSGHSASDVDGPRTGGNGKDKPGETVWYAVPAEFF